MVQGILPHPPGRYPLLTSSGGFLCHPLYCSGIAYLPPVPLSGNMFHVTRLKKSGQFPGLAQALSKEKAG
ncbi:hypothetical protein LIER_28241 [Lithospermum erythrorhizon]|uniref:Uncharacterized protein n=1 Tax=Lithospermum erythrorhizon TaxID=34254 RepID=A0AAV3RGX4_LITER